jgi:uncharacterized protein (DUF433 family)
MEQVGEMLGRMNRSEKAALLQWVVSDLGDAYPGIDVRPDVCDGEACLVRTRIPVWTLVQARRLGTSEADLLRAYPCITAEDLAEAWAYYRGHRTEVDAQIAANERA